MGKILCATRGGEDSYRTQDAAVRLAKERGDALVFFYVVDIHFLDKTAAPIVVNVENEVTKMGEFILLMAQERAAAQGIPAQAVVCQGQLRTEVAKAVKDMDVDLVVLGRPQGSEAVFDEAALQAFAALLEMNTGVEVRIP